MWNILLKQKSNLKRINDAVDVSDAIDKSFEYDVDKVFILLDTVEIQMNLVYQFSDLLADFLQIITEIIDNQNGEGYFGFSQNDIFDADWKLNWTEDYLNIKVDWRALENEDISLLSETFQFSKKQFINSWKDFFSELYSKLNLKNLKLEYSDEKIILEKIISN